MAPRDGLNRTSWSAPVNDALPESLTADLVFTGLHTQNSATSPVCLAEMDRSRTPIAA
jgi:hypothetical protein